MNDIEDTGSIFDATETPRADVLRYAVAYPLVPVLAAVGVTAASTAARPAAVVGLLVVMFAGSLGAVWVARPRDRTDMETLPGEAYRDEGVERSDVFTSDAAQRFRVFAFGMGAIFWGVLGLVAIAWALPAAGLTPDVLPS